MKVQGAEGDREVRVAAQDVRGLDSVLTNLDIEGFKSLRSVHLELGIVNVFIGANGSGKSNLLEALGVVGAALFGIVETEPLKYRGVRPGLPSLYKTSFRHARIPRIIKLRVSNGGASYSVGLENPINQPESRWKFQSESLYDAEGQILGRSRNHCTAMVGSQKVDLTPDGAESAVRAALQQQLANSVIAARDLVSRIVDFGIYSPNTNVLRGLASDVSKTPLGLSGSGLAAAIRELLTQWRKDDSPFGINEILELIDWARSFDSVPADQVPVSPAVHVGREILRFTDRYMASNRATLSAYDASEGALYVLFLVALASHPKAPPLFAVDNFDHALHPRLAARLMMLVCEGLLESGNRQLLLTTHNPLVLDGLDLRDERVRLFAVERARRNEKDMQGTLLVEGETIVRRIVLTTEMLKQVDQGMSLSRLWVMGRIGGMPVGM